MINQVPLEQHGKNEAWCRSIYPRCGNAQGSDVGMWEYLRCRDCLEWSSHRMIHRLRILLHNLVPVLDPAQDLPPPILQANVGRCRVLCCQPCEHLDAWLVAAVHDNSMGP